MPSFDERFQRATGNDPFPYQRRFATEGDIPELVKLTTASQNPRWPCRNAESQ